LGSDWRRWAAWRCASSSQEPDKVLFFNALIRNHRSAVRRAPEYVPATGLQSYPQRRVQNDRCQRNKLRK
jgi:hypothetical protein